MYSVKNTITEKTIYCFVAKLKYVDKDDCFLIPFKVLAEDCYQAQSILEKWLSDPKQTGFKYDVWVGIIPKPSEKIIVIE